MHLWKQIETRPTHLLIIY